MAAHDGAEPEIDIWSGGLKWALEKGYRRAEKLQTVREELLLWLENLDELIKALGPQATVGTVLQRAVNEDEDEGTDLDEDDDDEDD